MVPPAVMKAYLEYFDAARPAVEQAFAARFGPAGGRLEIGVTDSKTVKEVCGGNYALTDGRGSAPERWVLSRFVFPSRRFGGAAGSGGGPSRGDVDFARTTLAALFPRNVEIVLAGAGGRPGGRVVVPLPGSYLVNGCAGGGGSSESTVSVSVCSMYRGGSRYWWAVPWFSGKFVQFDVSPQLQTPTQYGVMRFAPVPSGGCRF